MRARLLFVATLIALSGCSRPAPPLKLPDRGEVSFLRVRDMRSAPPKSFEIDDPEVITRYLEILHRLNSDWNEESNPLQDQELSIGLVGQDRTVLLATWIGPDWLGGAELQESSRSQRLRPITVEQKDELLRLLQQPGS